MVGGCRTLVSSWEVADENLALPQPETYLEPSEAWEALRQAFESGSASITHQTLADQVAELKERVEYLERLAPAWREHPSYFEVRDAMSEVRRFTKQIFGCDVNEVEGEDCEIPGDRYFVFDVSCGADSEALLQKHHEWHALLSRLPSNVCDLFRLEIDPVEA